MCNVIGLLRFVSSRLMYTEVISASKLVCLSSTKQDVKLFCDRDIHYTATLVIPRLIRGIKITVKLGNEELTAK